MELYVSVSVTACIYLAGCVHRTQRRMAARGRDTWGRWRVDSICIWHTDCTKYANRQTMTFAVLFCLWYCRLSKQKEYDVAAYRFACASAQLMHLPGVPIFLSRLHELRPWSTNHMKGLPSVQIALSKVTLMYEKGAGVFERKSYRCRSARGGEIQWHVWCWVLSCLLASVQTTYTVFQTAALVASLNNQNSWPFNLRFGWDSLPQNHPQTDSAW